MVVTFTQKLQKYLRDNHQNAGEQLLLGRECAKQRALGCQQQKEKGKKEKRLETQVAHHRVYPAILPACRTPISTQGAFHPAQIITARQIKSYLMKDQGASLTAKPIQSDLGAQSVFRKM